MDKEYLIDKIYFECPNLYPHPVTFECMDGWIDLIYRLSTKLENLIVKFKQKYPNDECAPYCVQVKQKYAKLRFYMSCSTEQMDKAIDEAEDESSRTCEVCGKPGKINNGPWYYTLCQEHNESVTK